MSRSTPGVIMSKRATGSGYRHAGVSRFAVALVIALFGTVAVGQAAAADESPVPEDVAAYFATGLIPRLADLYGSPGSKDPTSTFDATTQVGTIHRLLAWTPAFLAGQKTDNPTELTNTWIAPVTAKEGTILGLAAVWINPGSNIVELADFARGRALVDALGRAPKDTLLIDDTVQQAWFATDGKTLTPLVVGKSGAKGPLTLADYQKTLPANSAPTEAPDAVTNPGFLIAGITLGAVVLLLAIFVLLPGRKSKAGESRGAGAVPRRNPRGESGRAFDRAVSSTEARATSVARAAVSAEASLVDAMSELTPEPPERAPLRPARPFIVDDEPAPPKLPTPSVKRATAPRKSTASTTAAQKAETLAAGDEPSLKKAPATKATANDSSPKSAANPKAAQKTAPKKAASKKETPKSAE
jgi:hypothetical protein